ncbi:hypothetical protein FZC33_24155 [Labrys sp. KNU-23]|uniref:hypothetical protein n=1 Tax=Labrys sp. KNU-23 TaxID=2789216 RepID=UPI0011EC1A3B|nr:hypothetical protein [Labrys sp. KNU-23]QEN89210.1 hypothetical protein FZC33_24155 [Labrys sp. KNU-23]
MSMKQRPYWPILLASWLLFAVPAQAQEPPAAGEQRCRDFIANLAKLNVPIPKIDKVSAKSNGGCLYTGSALEQGHVRWSIDTIDLDRIEPDPAGADKMPFAMRISLNGIRVSGAVAGDPVFSYVQQLTAPPMALSLDYERDASKDALKVNALTFNTSHGALSLSAELARIEPMLKSWSPQDVIMRTALKSLEFNLHDEDGEIQRLVAMPLALTLLKGSSDPAARLAELKQQGATWMRLTLGLLGVPKESTEEAIAAMMELPKATKPFYLGIKLPQPVGVEDLFRAMVGGVSPGTLFPDGSITATYGK